MKLILPRIILELGVTEVTKLGAQGSLRIARNGKWVNGAPKAYSIEDFRLQISDCEQS
jgi:hypothetical protein